MPGGQQVPDRFLRQAERLPFLCPGQQLLQHTGGQLAIGDVQHRRTAALLAGLEGPGFGGLPGVLIDLVRQHEGSLLPLGADEQGLPCLGAGLLPASCQRRFSGSLEYLDQSMILHLADPDNTLSNGDQCAVRLNLEQFPLSQRLLQPDQDAAILQMDPGLTVFRRAGGFQADLRAFLHVDLLISIGIQRQLGIGANAEPIIALQKRSRLSCLGGLVRVNDLQPVAGGSYLDFPGKNPGIDALRLCLLRTAAQQQRKANGRQQSPKYFHVSSPFNAIAPAKTVLALEPYRNSIQKWKFSPFVIGLL